MEKKKFGQFIKESRLKKGLTQKELADLLFIDVTAVSKWERGTSDPSTSNLFALAKLFGVSAEELLKDVSE